MKCNVCQNKMFKEVTSGGQQLKCLRCGQKFWRATYWMVGFEKQEPSGAEYKKILKALSSDS